MLKRNISIIIIVSAAICSCHQNESSNESSQFKEQINKDSVELARRIKVIDFATEMAKLKARQGYTNAQLAKYRDSILKANNVDTLSD